MTDLLKLDKKMENKKKMLDRNFKKNSSQSYARKNKLLASIKDDFERY